MAAATTDPVVDSVDALFLHAVGHRLAREGNALFDVRVRPDGRIAFTLARVESPTAGYLDGDAGQRPARDFDPKRLGAHPPESLVRLRLQVETGILGLFGISPSLVSSNKRWHDGS